MPNADITRSLDQPKKHYSGARIQQGRPILDSDFNEGAAARGGDRRDLLLDVIGPSGSTDDGFLPALKVGDIVQAKLVRFGAFTQAFVLDYPLKPGSMYAGGALWEQNDPEPVIFQREFLQMGVATAPRAALGEQRQLSYLRGWEQPVTAIEDGEIQEPALGGADAATRVRRHRRVEIRNVQAGDCEAAFTEVLEDLGHGDTATYDPVSRELRSNARLQMTFQGSPDVECGPCTPSLEGRYLGSESHAIRIMLAAPDHYVWAFDNAAPAYRVRLILDGAGGATVEMLTPPKDAHHYPRQHTVVELIPWEALLENGKPQGGTGETVMNERCAARVGFFAEVDGTYDASSRTFHVRLAAGVAFDLGAGKGMTDAKAQMQAAADLKGGSGPMRDGIAVRWDTQHPLSAQLNAAGTSATGSTGQGFEAYLYMRVWHLKRPEDPLTIPTSSQKALGQTGLVPVLTGRGRPGDFWTIAVRPEAPDEIRPQEIMQDGGLPPQGPREVVAPISIVRWRSTTGIGHEVLSIDDCRPTLTALTERGCCTYDVGAGGDFETIQAAVDALPASGGRICVRPGVYREEIRIAGKSDVVVAGCGGHTRIETPVDLLSEALVTIELGAEHRDISLRDLTIDARGQIGVLATDGSRVVLCRVDIAATAIGTSPARSAIHAARVTDVRIARCHIEMGGAFTDWAAVFIDTPGGALIEGNTILTRRDLESGSSFAWGGIHIAGGSRDVEIRGNVIRGGRGHGITLGSAAFRALNGESLGVQGAGRGSADPEPPFSITGIVEPVLVLDPNNGGTEYFPEPLPAIEGLLIADNHIEGAGGSGISSPALEVALDDRSIGPPLCFRRRTFAVRNAVLEDNRILDNVRQRASNDPERSAVGGIVLSDAIRTTIRDNRIEENGAGLDAPICGISVAHGEHVSVIGNRIRANGSLVPPVPSESPITTLPLPGRGGTFGPRFQGGIVIAAPEPGSRTELLNEDGPRNIHLRRNVVDQPASMAAVVVSRGACRITGNYFHSQGSEGRIFGPAVFVFSAGKPWEAVDLPVGEPSPDRWRQPQGSQEYLNGRAQQFPEGDGGALLFSGNHITVNGTGNPPTGGFGAFLVSFDHLSISGNQFMARTGGTTPLPQVMAIGLTAHVAGDRIAESVEATPVSLAVMAPMLAACGSNQLTHCPAIFGCANHGNPDYFFTEDNLVWLRPPDGRCEPSSEPVITLLRRLCFTLFEGTREFPDNTILRGLQP